VRERRNIVGLRIEGLLLSEVEAILDEVQRVAGEIDTLALETFATTLRLKNVF
jgi:hypothetical protein